MDLVIKPPKKRQTHAPKAVNRLAPRWTDDQTPRILIIGASGCGKTALLIALIRSGFIPWKTLQMCCRTIDTPDYIELRREIEKIEKRKECTLQSWTDKLGGEKEPWGVLRPENVDPRLFLFTVFDDWMLEKDQSVPDNYFSRIRPRNGGAVYVAQEYFGCTTCIRSNATMVIVFKGLKPRDVEYLRKDCAPDFTPDEFRKIYHDATDREHGYLVLDKEPAEPEWRVRVGWDIMVVPDSYAEERGDDGKTKMNEWTRAERGNVTKKTKEGRGDGGSDKTKKNSRQTK